jgi:hypothetical protein
MTKKRKLHQIQGIIKGCWPGQVTSKGPHKNQPFYCLDILSQSLFTKSQKETIYAFPNLVSQEIWKTLEQQTYQDKKFLFHCEKRTRGWRLKDWEEIN